MRSYRLSSVPPSRPAGSPLGCHALMPSECNSQGESICSFQPIHETCPLALVAYVAGLRIGQIAGSGRHRWRSRRLGCLGRSSPLRGRPRLRFGFIAISHPAMCPTKWSPMVRRTSVVHWPGSEPSANSAERREKVASLSRKAAGASVGFQTLKVPRTSAGPPCTGQPRERPTTRPPYKSFSTRTNSKTCRIPLAERADLCPALQTSG